MGDEGPGPSPEEMGISVTPESTDQKPEIPLTTEQRERLGEIYRVQDERNKHNLLGVERDRPDNWESKRNELISRFGELTGIPREKTTHLLDTQLERSRLDQRLLRRHQPHDEVSLDLESFKKATDELVELRVQENEDILSAVRTS